MILTHGREIQPQRFRLCQSGTDYGWPDDANGELREPLDKQSLDKVLGVWS
jgi:hypothetical protein